MFFVPFALAAVKGAAIGAGLGAAGAAVTGGDMRTGAMLGAASGGTLGGLGSIGSGAAIVPHSTPASIANVAEPLGRAAHSFNKGLAGAVGIGGGGTGKAASAGNKVGTGLVNLGGQAALSAAMRPKPAQRSMATNYGSMPPPIAKQQRQQQPQSWRTITVMDAFQRGLS